MAKTLTDRISVRVTAKSETDANNQKKNDANNIAKALGKDGDLDDTKASSVASKLGNTITDENGTTWAKSSEVAAAAKELGDKGALDGNREIELDGNTYRMIGSPNAASAGTTFNAKGSLKADGSVGHVETFTIKSATAPVYYGHHIYQTGTNTQYELEFVSQGPFVISGSGFTYTQSGKGYTRNGKTAYYLGWADGYIENDKGTIYTSSFYPDPSNNGTICAYAYFYGNTVGKSKVDTSKSEDQIKDEIESKAWAQGKAAKINPIEPNETYIAVTDANGNPLYFLGT